MDSVLLDEDLLSGGDDCYCDDYLEDCYLDVDCLEDCYCCCYCFWRKMLAFYFGKHPWCWILLTFHCCCCCCCCCWRRLLFSVISVPCVFPELCWMQNSFPSMPYIAHAGLFCDSLELWTRLRSPRRVWFRWINSETIRASAWPRRE